MPRSDLCHGGTVSAGLFAAEGATVPSTVKVVSISVRSRGRDLAKRGYGRMDFGFSSIFMQVESLSASTWASLHTSIQNWSARKLSAEIK